MRYVRVLDNITQNITKDGVSKLGDGYASTQDINKADAILIRASDINDLEFPPSIRCIARSGSGVNNIPYERVAKQGIVVFNAPGANSNAVKELVLGMMLSHSRDVTGGVNWCLEHADDPDITKDAERSKKAFVGHELMGKKVGVVGVGNIGSKVANALSHLGAHVFWYDPYLSVEHALKVSASVTRVHDLDDLCRDCDYLTLHVPSKEDTRRMMAELFGRETGYCKGRGGSLHVADVSRGILGANGIVGGGIPIATGAALGSWIRGSDEVTVCFFGEGASNEGTFHESVNMAAIWKLPVVYVVENNQWAVNTPAEAVLNTPGVAERAVGYGIPGVRIDGNDVELVYNTVGAAVERARRGEGPSIVELYTFRMRAHNSADREIRPQELRDEWEAKSPIRRARAKLLAMGVSESELEEIDAAATAEIEEAYRFASASPYPDPATVCDNVFRNDNERGTVR